MSEHTPGPWRDMGFGGVGACGSTDTYAGPVWGTIAICKETRHRDGEGRTWQCGGGKEANARLIAVAPELFALARAYEEWEADIIMNGDWSNTLPRLTQAQYDRMMELQAMRNAAIAKARGE